MTTKPTPTSVDGYLAGLSADKRAALERLRKIIRSVIPNVDEAISYGMPGFRLAGKWVIWIGAGAAHCAMYGVSGNEKTLAGYDVSGRGTLRFRPDDPLPEALVRKLVKERVAKTQTKATKTTKTRKARS